MIQYAMASRSCLACPSKPRSVPCEAPLDPITPLDEHIPVCTQREKRKVAYQLLAVPSVTALLGQSDNLTWLGGPRVNIRNCRHLMGMGEVLEIEGILRICTTDNDGHQYFAAGWNGWAVRSPWSYTKWVYDVRI